MDKFGTGSYVDEVNSMVLPGVDVAAEIDAIHIGQGVWLGNNRWEINNRVYVDKGNGTAYPESGDSVISPHRLTLIALKYLIESGGSEQYLALRTGRNPNFDPPDGDRLLSTAVDLYAIWKTAKEADR